jgi:hypothetical protein
MLDFNSNSSDESVQSIKQELTKLCDQYTEFNDYCAFFCAATSALLLNTETETNKNYAQGAGRFAYQLIERSQYFEDRLQQLLRGLGRAA